MVAEKEGWSEMGGIIKHQMAVQPCKWAALSQGLVGRSEKYQNAAHRNQTMAAVGASRRRGSGVDARIGCQQLAAHSRLPVIACWLLSPSMAGATARKEARSSGRCPEPVPLFACVRRRNSLLSLPLWPLI